PILGYSATEVVGRQTPALWHDKEELALYARRLSEELGLKVEAGFEVFTAKPLRNLPEENEWTFIHKDGRSIPVNLSVTALRDESGNISGFVGLVYDLTERKQAGAVIRKLNQELERRVVERTAQLEEVNRELEAFSYSVSHDLRTPLRAIDGFSHILQDEYIGKLDEEGKRLLDMVSGNANRMGQLIDDILQFSRTGRTEIRTVVIDMQRMAREVLDELQSTVTKIPNLQCEIGELPKARGDRAMMRQVFSNLISNALKFSRNREAPRIEVGGSIQGDEAVYYVRDNGAGFDMRYAAKLFGVFQRLHTAEEFEGTGIGLAIVKRIIARHGGRVWAEGKVNEGATMYFALPCIPANADRGG
ncbi:MAG: PAS domain S-box protein, partial [Gammaproteobacteria bacterium]|nr:PAS domain S-box protein [Gammaproteobacteria bacterium]